MKQSIVHVVHVDIYMGCMAMVQSTAVYIGIQGIVLWTASTDPCLPEEPVDSGNGPLTITGQLGQSVSVCILIMDCSWIVHEQEWWETHIYNI